MVGCSTTKDVVDAKVDDRSSRRTKEVKESFPKNEGKVQKGGTTTTKRHERGGIEQRKRHNKKTSQERGEVEVRKSKRERLEDNFLVCGTGRKKERRVVARLRRS